MAGIEGKARFLNTLQDAHARGRAVAVYAEADDYQAYEVGMVEHADGSETVLLCLTPKGEPDGRRAIRTDDIVRVDCDNSYIRRLELLYQYRESIFEKDFRAHTLRTGADLHSQLLNAKDSNTIVHLVDASDYGPSGFVRHVGDDYVEIERIGNNGEPDGTSTILMGSICKVHLGRRQDQVLEFLYRYNYDLKRLLES
jgi:hypothetical protein